MAESLGEKLRLAREARGITISEVSAQTRIATRYLEAIEENNYKPLPGGVFNKGFIKAYAKYVGVDEQEALSDYARIMAVHAETEDEGYKRPMVMTDDSRRSSWSSMIFAVIILVLLTGGVLLLVQWYRSAPVEPTKPTIANTNSNSNANSAVANTNTAPATDKLKVELKANPAAGGQAPSVTVIVDDGKSESVAISASPKVYEPQNNIKISFSKYQVANLMLTLNGKAITLPSQPLKPTEQAIKFEINKANAGQIMQSGQITLGDVPVTAPTDANTNVAVDTANTAVVPPTTTTPRVTPKPAVTPTKTPAVANTNTIAPVNKVTISIPTAKTPAPRLAATPTPKRP